MDQDLLTAEQVTKPELTDEEEKAHREGSALEEMVETSQGWAVVKKLLEDRAFHTWANPREAKSMDEWNYMELNSYYAAANARELLEIVEKAISYAHHLGKVKNGEVVRGRGGFKL